MSASLPLPAAVSTFPEMMGRRLLVLGLPLAAVGGLAASLPLAGYDLPAMRALLDGNLILAVRLGLLVLAYGLAGAAAYRRSRALWPTLVGILAGAAVGWSGWEWSSLAFGWTLFAAVAFMLEWQSPRVTALAVAAVVAWACFDDSAAWPALLLITHALSRYTNRRERLLSLGGGLLTLGVLLGRAVNLQAMYLTAGRSWVWADGQATNKLGDPMGAALFVLIFLLLLIWLLRPVKPSSVDLPTLAVFIFLAWHARRNGIWLGLAAVPAVAACLAGNRSRWATLSLAATQLAVLLMLLLAYLKGPMLVGGAPLSLAVTASIPREGLIVYRPAYEPALRRIRPATQLALAAPDLPLDEDGKPEHYTAWTRIATNCAPVDELDRLRARAIILDPHLDQDVISAIVENPGWQIVASDSSATLMLRTSLLP